MMNPFDGSGAVRRPRLESRIAPASPRRLTMLVAGPGFGKTTLLSQACATGRTVWHTVTAADSSAPRFARAIVEKMRLVAPEVSGEVLLAVEGGSSDQASDWLRLEAVAAALAEDVAGVDRRIELVVDDVHQLTEGAAAFLAALARHAPPGLHVVIASRGPLPFPTARLKLAGEAEELGEDVLAFTLDEVKALLVGHVGDVDDSTASLIHERTGGWPVAVVYAAEALGRGAVDIARALRGEDLMAYLAEEVLSTEDPRLVGALALLSPLPWFTPELLGRLADIDPTLSAVAEGSVPRHLVGPVPDVPGAVAVSPMIKDYLSASQAPENSDLILAAAAHWYEDQGHLDETLVCHLRSGDREAKLDLVKRRGDEMVATGLGRRVAALISQCDPVDDPSTVLLDADVRQLLGDWEGALAAYGRLVPKSGRMPARVAWRMGLVHHLLGDVSGALETYARGELDGADPFDGAALCAWTASAHWLRGDLEQAELMASRALELARETEAPRSMATAHTVLAMVAALAGDRAGNDTHYLRALEHAERARDVVQTIRIRSNRGSHFLEEGDYQAALAEIEIALRLADLTGFELWRGMALCNRGEVVGRLGSLDEAIADLGQARSVFRRIGSRLEAYPLAQLGDVYAARGDRSRAQSCHEQALEMLDEGDLQGLVPALSGLARLLAFDDTERARHLARRATEVDSVIGRARALVSLGWVELAAGDRESAVSLAVEAAEVARRRRDQAGLASALELQAFTGVEAVDVSLLEEARILWKEMGAAVETARLGVLIAQRVGGAEGAALAGLAAETLARLGAREPAGDARRIAESLTSTTAEGARVKTMGGFAVLVDGGLVPTSAWQSKVARDILAMLVANRGRPTHRELLLERLWPGEDPSKTANRFSVALSTIRNVLDPEKRRPSSHYLVSDRESVSLHLDHLEVDVEKFMDTAERGLNLIRTGNPEHGLALLRTAETMYVGDFLADHPYDEWAIPLREQARNTFVRSANLLAEADLAAGDHDAAARRLLRILETDPYDEPAHLRLVGAMLASGRHGTARRLYRDYVSRMTELEVEPKPFPG